jgi:ribosomal protein L11 methyltransferase
MSLSQVRVPLTRSQAQALVDAVMERDDLAATASAHEDESSGEWVFEATCTDEPDLDSFNEVARATLGAAVQFAVERIDPAVDWVARSLEGLKPVTAGGFYIHGSHDIDASPAGQTAILIDAAQAFGTGHHETTTGCLEAIDRVLKRKRIRRPLDVGTGTGVLAIAIAKRAKLPVIAGDIDPVAVRTAAANARQNGVGSLVTAVEAAGVDNRTTAENAPYDLVVANILSGPLATLAPSISRVSGRHATLILSGILNVQAQRVIAAYAAQGAILKERIVRGDWTTLILEKP